MPNLIRRPSDMASAWLAALVIFALSGFIAWQDWRDDRTKAEISVLNTAQVLADQTENLFDQINALLNSVGDRYATLRESGERERDRFAEEIRREVPYYPLVVRIGVTDQEGAVVLNTQSAGAGVPAVTIADRDYFQRAKLGDHSLIFSGPLQTRVTGEWAMVLARRIEGPDGRFLGVAFAVLPIESIGKQFSKINLGVQGIINLRALDFAQIVRFPALTGANTGTGNRTVSDTIRKLMQEAPEKDHYVYQTVAPIDGTERVYAYKRFDHSPFWMTVGRATADFGSTWKQTATLLALFSFAIAVILYLGARKLQMQNQQLAQRVAELDVARRKLSLSEETLRLFIEHAPAALAMFDLDMRYLSVSRRWLEDYGLVGENVIGRSHYDVFPGIGERWIDIHRRALAGETIKRDEDHFVLRSGRVLWLRWEVIPWHDADGAIGGIVIFNENITERVRFLKELEQVNAELEQRVARRTAELSAANQELEAFAYSVSHDLRAPLRALRGFSRALQEDYAGQLAGKGNQYLEEIRKAGSRMSEVIEGVLELSRSASGKLHCEEVDITALSHEVLKEFQDAEPDRQVSCDVEPGMKVQGDRAMMFVVLQNLLGNAWKYSANRPLASIRIASHADGTFTRYCVSDNGAGFNRNHAEMLFIPFQRLHRQDEFPGLGIGLATVRRIARRHGGELFVTFAEPGVGATFCFTLPNDPHEASTNAIA